MNYNKRTKYFKLTSQILLILIFTLISLSSQAQYAELSEKEVMAKKTELKAQGSGPEYPALYRMYHAYLSKITPAAFTDEKIIELVKLINQHPNILQTQIIAEETKVILTTNGDVIFEDVQSAIWDLGMVVHHHETKFAIKATSTK